MFSKASMEEADEYRPGLTWTQFVKQFAKNNGLTYNQAVSVGREAYHEYKLEEARLEKSSNSRMPSAEVKKHKKAVNHDADYQQFMAWKAKQEAPKPKKQRKKKVIYVSDSSSDETD